MQDLVEEAESIAASGYTKSSSKVRTKRVKKTDVASTEKTVRNVDEIIASLQTQTVHGEV